MRVLVLEFSARHQPARFDQGVNDCFIGVADFTLVGNDALAFEAGRLFGEGAVLVDRVGNARLDPALLKQSRARSPEFEILAPMAGSGVNEARARVFRHIVAVEQRNDEPVAMGMKRVSANGCFQQLSVKLVLLEDVIRKSTDCLAKVGVESWVSRNHETGVAELFVESLLIELDSVYEVYPFCRRVVSTSGHLMLRRL